MFSLESVLCPKIQHYGAFSMMLCTMHIAIFCRSHFHFWAPCWTFLFDLDIFFGLILRLHGWLHQIVFLFFWTLYIISQALDPTPCPIVSPPVTSFVLSGVISPIKYAVVCWPATWSLLLLRHTFFNLYNCHFVNLWDCHNFTQMWWSGHFFVFSFINIWYSGLEPNPVVVWVWTARKSRSPHRLETLSGSREGTKLVWRIGGDSEKPRIQRSGQSPQFPQWADTTWPSASGHTF